MNEENQKNILIDFEPISRRVKLRTFNKTLYDILTKIDVNIRAECGGAGKCGKCQLKIQKGGKFLNRPTDSEKKLLTKGQLEKGIRLACQTKIEGKNKDEIAKKEPPQIKIYLPEELLIEDFTILTTGSGLGVELNVAIEKIFLNVEESSLERPIPDLERTLMNISRKISDLHAPLNIEFGLLKKLPQLLRKKENAITITIWDNREIIDIETGNKVDANYGVAFDIGTTTLVGYLINLNDQKIHAVHSKLNPQTAYGEDVITRITYIKDNEGTLETLQMAVIQALNEIINKVCQKANISPSHIYEATIVGNSVMHHIFLGLTPIHLGLSPYIPVVQQGLSIRGENVELQMSKYGKIYTLPLIAGFVGADTMGVILSSEIYKEEALTLAIDIGTNGEVILGNKDVLAAGSCAAGSALEGAHISHGMRAAGGAIESLKINPKTLDVSYETIKNKKPIGICGSGLIDAVAEMLKAKILTRSGAFNKELFNHDRLIEEGNSIEFIIAYEHETPIESPITLSLQDIRELQMAKGAFYSGARLLLNHLEEKHRRDFKIEQIFLAGAFGNYINKENARFIGMIPDIESDKIHQIGNAAGIGAQYCLINKGLRKKATRLLKKIDYVEIAIEKKFQKEYAKAMYFPHMNLKLFPSLKFYESIPKR